MPYKDPEQRRSYSSRHYLENKDAYKIKRLKAKRALQDFVYDYKMNNPCHDCGEYYHYSQMQFDHVSDDKVSTVAALMRNSTMTKVKEEIAKCELVCANCRAFRTWHRSMRVL